MLDGGSPTIHPPVRSLPLTIRERARIQGFPDDFVFYGEVTDDDFRWDHYKNNALIKQSGKCIPLQFVKYASRQVAAPTSLEKRSMLVGVAHLAEADEHCRLQRSNGYCENIGYADQERACAACWLYSGCTIRGRK